MKISFIKKIEKLNILQLLLLLTYIVLFTSFLSFCGLFDNPPNKNQIKKLLNENIDIFEDAMEYIHTLDSDVFGIGYDNGILHLNDSSYTHPEISNEAIQKIFDLGVESIYIKNKNAGFSFKGGSREYYTGIIYSHDGKLITHQLDDRINESHISFTKAGNGWEWKQENGDNHYYCEKITGNWYYYQMEW